MAADATQAYITAHSEGKDAAILCDRWEVADAINQRWFSGRADGLKMRGLVHFIRARVGR